MCPDQDFIAPVFANAIIQENQMDRHGQMVFRDIEIISIINNFEIRDLAESSFQTLTIYLVLLYDRDIYLQWLNI